MINLVSTRICYRKYKRYGNDLNEMCTILKHTVHYRKLCITDVMNFSPGVEEEET